MKGMYNMVVKVVMAMQMQILDLVINWIIKVDK
jgi:hypothetical protein